MIDVEIEDQAWRDALPDAEAIVRRAAEATRSSFPLKGRGREKGGGSSVTILLTNDDEVRRLNADFRGKNAPTNVLSFSAPETAHPHLGDIVLAFGVCTSEAVAQKKPLAHHLTHLTAHGVLHLFGYDHLSDEDAEVMEDLEREILGGLGVPDPYASSADDDGL